MSKILQGFSVQSTHASQGLVYLGSCRSLCVALQISHAFSYLDALSVRRNAVLGQGGQIEACLPE